VSGNICVCMFSKLKSKEVDKYLKINNDGVTYEQVGFIWRPKWGNENGRNGESI